MAKFNTKQNWICFFAIVFFLGAIAMLIISFIWMIQARNQVRLFSEGFGSLTSNWDSDMVFDISPTEPGSLPADGYVTSWQGKWPGTVAGCYCWQSNSRMKVRKGLKDRPCNTNETRLDCKDITQSDAKDMPNWAGSTRLYATRIRGTSFLDNYQNINEDGTCKSGFKNCGDKGSRAKGLCIKNSIADCPITDIKTSTFSGARQVTFPLISLYVGNANSNNPVCDLSIAQNHLCFVRSQYPLADGRSKYLLLNGDYESCFKDQTAWSVDEMGEIDYLNINGIDYNKLIDYNPSNDYRYRLMVGRVLDWSPACADIVPSMMSKSNDLNKTYSQYKILFGLYIASLSIAGIGYCVAIYGIVKEKVKVIKVGVLIRVISFLLIVTSMFICVLRINNFQGYFKSIVEQECSNDATNQNFKQISDSIKTKIHSKNVIFIVLSFVGMFIEIVIAVVVLKLLAPSYGDSPYAPSSSPSSPVTLPSPVNNNENTSPVMGTGFLPPPKNPEGGPILPPNFERGSRTPAGGVALQPPPLLPPTFNNFAKPESTLPLLPDSAANTDKDHGLPPGFKEENVKKTPANDSGQESFKATPPPLLPPTLDGEEAFPMNYAREKQGSRGKNDEEL